MEKSEIQFRVKNIKSLEEFARLLNDIKIDEFGTINYQISGSQLIHYSFDKIVPKRYKTFQICKKSGGVREINAPCYQLSIILYLINILLKAVYTPKSCVMGFAEGRSIVMNASIHTGHHYVFNIDLENFFPSIPQARVWARLQLAPFKFPVEVANVVAGLCCHTNAEGTQNVLPQGAATSPLLTNAICDKLDRRMLGVAKKYGLHYSRYADDMTFSSMHNVYQENSDFRNEIRRIIEEQGFKMNDKKTRLLRDGQRQEVTGLTVNENVNLTKKYIRDLRCILHKWEKEGYGKAYAYFYPFYKKEKGYIKKGEPVMENVIGGKLNYMRMVKGEGNAAYKKLLYRFNKLQEVVFVDTDTDKGNSYVYVHSYAMKDFEESFHTSITLEVSSKQKLLGKCQIAGMDKVLPISKSTQLHLCPNLSELESETVVNSDLLNNCFVTLCRAKGKNFWLITKAKMNRSRCLSVLNANVDVDSLLDIWEKEGIRRAAQTFKELILSKETTPSDSTPNNKDKTEKKRPIKPGKVWTSEELKALADELPFIDDPLDLEGLIDIEEAIKDNDEPSYPNIDIKAKWLKDPEEPSQPNLSGLGGSHKNIDATDRESGEDGFFNIDNDLHDVVAEQLPDKEYGRPQNEDDDDSSTTGSPANGVSKT